MFERFTDDVRDVIIAAQEEARLLRREEIGTEHLLLGVIRIRPGIAGLMPGETASILTAARTAAGTGMAFQANGYIPYGALAQQVISSVSWPVTGIAGRIEPEHLLLALLNQSGGTGARRLLAALNADCVALRAWAGQSLADGTFTTVRGDDAHGSTDDGQPHYPALMRGWRPSRLLAIWDSSLWGSAMEGARPRHRIWLLTGLIVSLAYAAVAAAAYGSGQLKGTGREPWRAALLVVLGLSLGALVYWSGKGFGSLTEGWRIAGPVNGSLIVLGYVAAGLLPLAIVFGAAIGISMLSFSGGHVVSLLSHLGSIKITIAMEWLILVPLGLGAAIFAAYTPFWHYSWTPLIYFWRSIDSIGDALPDTVGDADYSSLDARFAELYGRRYTGFGTAMMEQLTSSMRARLLVVQYTFSGREAVLDEALAAARVAADVCLRNPRLARNYFYADIALGELADALWAVYRARPDPEALQDAIWARDQLAGARSLSVISGRARWQNAHELARLLLARYELAGDESDLSDALALARSAARRIRRGNERAAALLTLGRAEETRLERDLAWSRGEPPTRELSDAARLALEAAEAAFRAGAEYENDADECTYRLAMLLARKAACTGDASGREEALRVLRGAVGEPAGDLADGAEDLGPPDMRAQFIVGLADVLASAAADKAAVDEAVTWYRTAAAIAEAPALLRLEAACGWGYLATNPVDAAAGLELAVELLTLAASPGIVYDTALRQLARWAELPTDAAAAQLAIGQPERAVELLEHSRAVMWSRRMALRTAPLDKIGAADGLSRERLAAIRAELDVAVLRSAGRRHPGRQDVAAERRAILYREWNRAMQDHGLLRPATFAELKAAAADGAVVLLNVSRRRTDALIITTDLPLGHLSLHADIYDKTRAVVQASRDVAQARGILARLRDDAEANDAGRGAVGDAENRLRRAQLGQLLLIDDMLRKWLWSDVAEPVLRWLSEHGKLTRDGDGLLPRLWWCPTGWLTFMPLHAAGSRIAPRDSVMDQVVSSYTPTLTQLIRARDLVRGQAPHADGQVLVLAPDSGLPYARAEAEMASRIFPDHLRLAEDADADTCLREISRSAVLHFVGHGQASEYQGPGGYSQSGGLNVGPRSQPAFLSARELAELPLARARFAYLSVCESATPDHLIPDEATHPAAVLHFGGFPYVVATLHPVPDRSGIQVAADTYAVLVREGALDERRSARALHQALHTLRRQEPGSTAPWTTYVHVGP